MAEYINKIFNDKVIIQRIKKKLPELFQMANAESSRAGKVGMEVGVLISILKKICIKIIFAILLCININLFGMGIKFPSEYAKIDSLQQIHCGRVALLDIKNKELELTINNQVMVFCQKYIIDSIRNKYHYDYVLWEKVDTISVQTTWQLLINDLLSFNSDSIFVSATFFRSSSIFNKKNNKFQIDKLPIARADLLGMEVFVPRKEMNKSYKGMVGFLIGFGTAIMVGQYFAYKSEKK
ncbi:MAG: ThaI family type II restriction endonuclease [Bacteroidetes bacterium]|nr:ThaI family type II restriction endonuclease [Bacteroidota bacterium]